MGTPRIPSIGEDVTDLMDMPAPAAPMLSKPTRSYGIGEDVSDLMGGPQLPGPRSDDETAPPRVMARNDVPTPAPPRRSAGGTLRDLGTMMLNFAIGVPEAAVGLADLGLLSAEFGARELFQGPGQGALSAKGGRLARALESVGFQPGEARNILGQFYSEAQKAAQANVANADGVIPTIKAAVNNPSVIAQTAIESGGSMLLGGGIARGVTAAAKAAPVIAAAIGEGAVTAGQQAEQTRQASGGELTPKQGAIAATSGAVTGGLGLLGGKLAQKFGFPDVDALLAGAQQNPAAKGTIVKMMVGAAAQEGLLEELPQSVQEQVAQNLSTGRPAWENVDQEAVLGAMAGGVMGGGGAVVSSVRARRAPSDVQPELPYEPPQAEQVAPPQAPPVSPPVASTTPTAAPETAAIAQEVPPVGADVTDLMQPTPQPAGEAPSVAPEPTSGIAPSNAVAEPEVAAPVASRRDMLIAAVQAARAQGKEDIAAFEALQQLGMPPELERRSATLPPPDEGMPSDVPQRRSTDIGTPDTPPKGGESVRPVQIGQSEDTPGQVSGAEEAEAPDDDFRAGGGDSSFAGTGKLQPGQRMTLEQYAEHYEHKGQTADALNELNEQERGGKRLKKADVARRQTLAEDLKKADKRAKFLYTFDTHYGGQLLDDLLAKGLETLDENDLTRAYYGAKARARLEGRAQASQYFPNEPLLDRIEKEMDRRHQIEMAKPHARPEDAMPLATLPKDGRVFEVDGELYVRDWSNVSGGKLGRGQRYNTYRVVPIEDYKGDVGPFTQEEHDALRDSHTSFFYGREDDYEDGEDLIAGAEQALIGDRIRGTNEGVAYSAGGKNYVATGETLYVTEDPNGKTPNVIGAKPAKGGKPQPDKPTLGQYDSPEAHKAYVSFKTRLTKLQNKKDHQGAIALWKEFEEFYNSRNWPMPDAWRTWEGAAEDAQYELDKAGARGHFAEPGKPVEPATKPVSEMSDDEIADAIMAQLASEQSAVATPDKQERTTQDVPARPAKGEGARQAGRPARDRDQKGERTSAIEERRDTSDEGLYRRVLHAAQRLDPSVDADDLRSEFNFRISTVRELQQDYAQSGRDPRDLLGAIASYGGIWFEKGGGFKGEIEWLKEGEKFGAVHGVKGVFRKDGLTPDVMVGSLQQEARFAWIEDVNDLLDALDLARRDQGKAKLGDVMKDAGIKLGEAWWTPSWRGAQHEPGEDVEQGDATEDDIPHDADTSFDVNEFGEAQPRLPDAGAVRDQNIKTPAIDMPFSLSGEADTSSTGAQEGLSFNEPEPEAPTPAEAATPAPPKAETEAKVTVNTERRSVEVKFPSKPDEAIREELKRRGFRWAKANGVWYKSAPGQEAGLATSIRELLGVEKAAEPQRPTVTFKDGETVELTKRSASRQYSAGDSVIYKGESYTVDSPPYSGDDLRITRGAGLSIVVDARKLDTPTKTEAPAPTKKKIPLHARWEEARQQASVRKIDISRAENIDDAEAILAAAKPGAADLAGYETAYKEFVERQGQGAEAKEPERDTFGLTYQQAARIRQDVVARLPKKPVSPNTDLDARKAANKAKRDALAKQLAEDLGTTLNAGVPDPKHVKAMVGIIRTYIDDGIVEFERAWRQFKEEYAKLAPMLERPFEIAWQMLRGEDKKVADISTEEAKPHQESAVSGETFPPRTGQTMKFADLNGLFHHFAQTKLTEWPTGARELRETANKVMKTDLTDRTDEIVDAVEGALNVHYRREMIGRGDDAADYVMGGVAIEKHMPRAWRSLEKTDLQQFSTPLPIAGAAQHAAQVRDGDKVLEPTAGTGNLISLIPGGQVDARELSDRRVEVLKAQGFDAKQGDYLTNLQLKDSADVIITNPPWGKYSTGKYGAAIALDFTPVDVAERFVAKNVRDLKAGGRLVAIMPTTMLRSPGFRTFLNKQGTLRALIQSPMGGYDSRATSVDSILMVWDKVKYSNEHRESEDFRARQTLIAVGNSSRGAPQDWKEYAELVSRIPARAAATEATTRADTASEPASGRPAEPARPAATVVGGRGGAARPGSTQPGSDAPVRTPSVQTGRQPDVVADRPSGERSELVPRGAAPRLAREDTRDPTRGLSNDAKDAYRAAEAAQHFAPYRLRSDLRGVRHPKLVVEARALSGVPYPELTTEPTPRVRKIVESGRVSIEQAEQALAAVQANIVGQHGYLAADNVGVGKSREIALVIIDMMERAKKAGKDLRLMVTTYNGDTEAGLIDNEMLQEVLGGEDPGFEIVKARDYKDAKKEGDAYKPFPKYKHAIYVVDSFNLREYRKGFEDVGLHGIIGDEVHTYKNADAAVGAAWQTLHARIMLGVPRHEQVFAYFTATPAQSVYDYRYLYGLREWPVDGFQDWIEVVTGSASQEDAKKLAEATETGAINPDQVRTNIGDQVVGGDSEDTPKTDKPNSRRGVGESVFMQALSPSEAEQIPREWKVKGKFSSRDLWRAGTEFAVETRELKAHHKRRYDQFAELARAIFNAHRKFGRMDKSGQRSSFGPGSALQNAAKRMQMQPAIEEAIEIAKDHLAQGYQPVLSLINVNEADPEGGNIRAAIEQINTREKDKTEDGEIIDVGDIPEAIIAKAELLEQAKALGLLDNPLLLVTEAFGADNVALIVGGTGKKRGLHAQQFQEGKRKVAVISAAGTTGINLDHRVALKGDPIKEKRHTKDGSVSHIDTYQRGRRVFIDVQYEWSASKAVQRYGRVDRSASITPPKIVALNFGSASEKKFLATVANRMASLGALSKGGSESTGASALEEFEITGHDSLQGAVAAWDKLSDEDKAYWIGSAFEDPGQQGERDKARHTRADMRQIQLALLWLPIDKANEFWEKFIAERESIREAMGYLDERRAKRYKGEILRAIDVDDTRTLFQVKNDNNERFGILQGLVMGDMPAILPHLKTPDGRGTRRYVTFTADDGRVVAGLEIPWTRVKGVARLFGAMVEGEQLDTPDKVTEALHAGDKVELAQKSKDGAPWVLRERNDGKIAVDGMKMADRDLVEKYKVVGYSQVGNFWFVTDLPKFLERFPAKGAEVRVDVSDEDPDDGGDSPLPSGRGGGGARRLPAPPVSTSKPFEPAKHRQGAVIAMLRRRLGNIPISVGRLHSKDSGIYKSDIRSGGKVVRGAQAIRLRYADSLFEAMHEFGHHIDLAILKIDRRDARWAQELIDLGLPTSRPSYTTTAKQKEGAAEFFRLYVMNPAAAAKEAPEYFKEFERRLNAPDQKALKDALLEAREGADAFLSQPHDTRGESRVRLAEEEPSTVRQIASEIAEDPSGAKQHIADNLMKWFIDDLQPLKNAVRSMSSATGKTLAWVHDAYVLARLARGSAMKAQAFLDDGVRGLNGQFLGPSLQTPLKMVGKDRYKQFGQYLVALRVLEVRERGIETGMQPSEAEAIIEKAKKSPAFEKLEEARRLVYQYQHSLLDYMKLHGALNATQVRAITKFADLYVPLQRVMDEATSYLGGGARRLVNRRSPIYRLLGSSRDIIDPFESIVKNTIAIVDMVEKNRAAQALVELAEQAPGSAHYMEALPAPQAATQFNLSQLKDQIRGALDHMGLGDAIPDNFEEALQQLVTVFTPVHFARGKESKENIVTVVRDGERQFWQIHDQNLADAIAHVGVKETGLLAQFGAFGKATDWLLTAPTRALRFTATTTPTFMLRNLTRDTLGAFLQSRYGFIPVWDNIRVGRELMKGESEEAQLFKASGVQQATMMGYDRKSRAQIVKNMRDRRSLYHPIDLLRSASTFIESSTRFAEFKNALAAGGEERGILRRLADGNRNRSTDEEALTRAALAARDVSTDFSRGGGVTRELNRYYAFLNARVQGYARIAETIKRDPAGVAMKVGWLAALSWLLALANDDDKEYQQKTESEKHAAWFWRVDPDKPFIEIQKPFEWGYVPDLVEATVEYIKRHDPIRFQKIKAEWSPRDLKAATLRVMPTVALPLLEANMNYSLFRGGPIVSPFDLDLPNDQIYNDFTSETAKALGRVMDLPPAFVDHVLVGYTSTMGRETIATTDAIGGKVGVFPERNLPSKAVQQYPFLGAFLDDARFTGQAREIQDLYAAADEVESLERGVRRDLNAGRKEQAFARAREAMSESEWLKRRAVIKAVRSEFRDIGKRLKAIHALPPQVASPQRKAEMIYKEREKMVDLAARALGRRALPSRKAANQ